LGIEVRHLKLDLAFKFLDLFWGISGQRVVLGADCAQTTKKGSISEKRVFWAAKFGFALLRISPMLPMV